MLPVVFVCALTGVRRNSSDSNRPLVHKNILQRPFPQMSIRQAPSLPGQDGIIFKTSAFIIEFSLLRMVYDMAAGVWLEFSLKDDAADLADVFIAIKIKKDSLQISKFTTLGEFCRRRVQMV